ncbi:MAG: homoserine dehydrogenase [Oscillospiraceae bacterium]|jgi:homoserine dehydrogenase|nr:homoserine dehydrogenase [Oscillospiraceae bacterium]
MKQVAILGYGIVGSGTAGVLRESAALIEARCGLTLGLKSILDIRQFPGDPFAGRFVSDFSAIETDSDVEIVVEAIGGTGAAYDFTKRALKAGKHVVTSNKELVAGHGAELLALARENRVNYLFEAAVGGGIPLIHPLTQCLTVNRICGISGILNGTSNYILTRMKENGFTFDEALLEAQKLGYAESDPTDDVMGSDTARKICILASLISGRQILPGRIRTEGIGGVTAEQLREAGGHGYAVKLLGRAQFCGPKPLVYVAPHLIPKGHPLHSVDGVFNGVMLNGDIVGDVFFYGRGAGSRPTASAILSDILACLRRGDPLGGLAWEDIPVQVAAPPDISAGPSFTFSDGTAMRLLAAD